MSRKLNTVRQGFTLIELLVVVLILAILMAVALPLYLSAVADSELKTCRSNMQTIATAEQAYKVQIPTHVYTTVIADLIPNLQTTPICPRAGTYTVTLVGTGSTQTFIVGCSYTGPPDHFDYAPGGM